MSKMQIKVHEASNKASNTATLSPEEVAAIHDACVENGLREKVSPGNLFAVFWKNGDKVRIYPYDEHGNGLSIRIEPMEWGGNNDSFITPTLQANCLYCDYTSNDISRIVPEIFKHLCALLKARNDAVHSYHYLCR